MDDYTKTPGYIERWGTEEEKRQLQSPEYRERWGDSESTVSKEEVVEPEEEEEDFQEMMQREKRKERSLNDCGYIAMKTYFGL